MNQQEEHYGIPKVLEKKTEGGVKWTLKHVKVKDVIEHSGAMTLNLRNQVDMPDLRDKTEDEKWKAIEDEPLFGEKVFKHVINDVHKMVESFHAGIRADLVGSMHVIEKDVGGRKFWFFLSGNCRMHALAKCFLANQKL
jgi:hypothetical protein